MKANGPAVTFPSCYVLQLLRSPAVTFPSCYVPQLLRSPAVTFSNCYVPQLLCSPTVMFSNCYVPQLLCSPPVTFPTCHVLQLLRSPAVTFKYYCPEIAGKPSLLKSVSWKTELSLLCSAIMRTQALKSSTMHQATLLPSAWSNHC